jgi:hypothetical protein
MPSVNELLQDILDNTSGGGTVPTDNFAGGLLDYNDLATATTPISHTGGATTPLTNDEAGTFTNKLYPPVGVTDVWDAINDEFDWSDLKLGDMVDIRLDIVVTTSSANQEITVELELGQGGFSYRIPFIQLFYKTSGVKKVGAFIGLYMGDANTLDNKGQFIFTSANNADIKVNGWFCKIIRRG